MLLGRTSRSIRNVERAVRIAVWLFQLKCSRISEIGWGKGKKPSWKVKNRVQRKGGVKVNSDNELGVIEESRITSDEYRYDRNNITHRID